MLKPGLENAKQGVDWGQLFELSFAFKSVERAFRCATKEQTRQNFSDPFLQGYFNAFGNLHGTMATLSSLTTLDIPCKERYPAVSGPTTIAHIATFNIRRMQLGDAVLGLTSMKGRPKLVHGKLSVLSQGTVVRATAPLPVAAQVAGV